ncbi:MAG: hypothetical protein JJE37_00710 [Methyloceanibacter sp.]|nr:hypothetical protein [Methyloceanibacter sp.]
MDRQSRAWLLAVGMALAATLCSLPLKAEEVSSVYTAHDLAKCADITPADAKDYGTVWRCKGYEGIDVRMAEGDLRIFVSYGPKAETQTAANATLPQFNNIGDTLEWRLAKAGGRWKPFATILRFSWGVDDRKGATLVVTKLGKDDACHLAYVEAAGNPKANDQARVIAARDARGFDCKGSMAKHYGVDGSLTKD